MANTSNVFSIQKRIYFNCFTVLSDHSSPWNYFDCWRTPVLLHIGASLHITPPHRWSTGSENTLHMVYSAVDTKNIFWRGSCGLKCLGFFCQLILFAAVVPLSQVWPGDLQPEDLLPEVHATISLLVDNSYILMSKNWKANELIMGDKCIG